MPTIAAGIWKPAKGQEQIFEEVRNSLNKDKMKLRIVCARYGALLFLKDAALWADELTEDNFLVVPKED